MSTHIYRRISLALSVLWVTSFGFHHPNNDQANITNIAWQTNRAAAQLHYAAQGFELGSMGGFYTFDEVVRELDSMHFLYPELVTEKFSIGKTWDSLDIWAVKISDNPDIEELEPEILYTGMHHAREPIAMEVLIYSMYYLLENYGTNPFVTFLLENRELYFVPVVCPDGYVYNQQTHPDGGGMFRKNKRDNNGDGIFNPAVDGVNLDANYSYQWGLPWSEPSSSHESYRGPAPFSEPETQAIRDFCISHDFRLALNYHSYWNRLFMPWGYEYDHYTPDSAVYMDLALEMTRYNNYIASVTTQETYRVSGTADDWMYGEQELKNKILSFAAEVGNLQDGWWPHESRIIPLAEENVYMNLILALGQGVIDADPHAISIHEPSVSSMYLHPGVDSVFATARINNPNSGSVSSLLIIHNSAGDVRVDVPLHDDGLHDDSLAGDGLFAGWSLAPEKEDNFIVDIQATPAEGLPTFDNAIGILTTIGPVVFGEIVEMTDTVNASGEYGFKLSLTNSGETAVAENIVAEIALQNQAGISIVANSVEFGDISAGESKVPSNSFYIEDYFWIETTASLPPEGVAFDLAISSNGTPFWSDTFLLYSYVATDDESSLPKSYHLYQNFPNPFNPTTSIRYELTHQSDVSLTVQDITGRTVQTLVREVQTAGWYDLQWDGTDFKGEVVGSGTYLLLLQAGNYHETVKLVFLK